MHRFVQNLLKQPVDYLANTLSSRPDKKRVDKALTNLYNEIIVAPGKRGLVLPFDPAKSKFIVFSDQHKGTRDGKDIFALAEQNYLAALEWYHKENFFYVALGDSEELWENLIITVKKHNKATFDAEKKFLKQNAFIKIFGNHDLYWDNDPLAAMNLREIYGQSVPIYEGLILKLNNAKKPAQIYMTHGHQGDLQSDGNWLSKWFVSDIWGPLQSYLRINPNTPSTNDQLKTAHNKMMYQWSSKRKNMLLITGHTHQPVFKSFTHLEEIYHQLEIAKKNRDAAAIAGLEKQIASQESKGAKLPEFTGYLDTYFNSGCCCFDDGDITGIELSDEKVRLIKWGYTKNKKSERIVLEESRLDELKLNS